MLREHEQRSTQELLQQGSTCGPVPSFARHRRTVAWLQRPLGSAGPIRRERMNIPDPRTFRARDHLTCLRRPRHGSRIGGAGSRQPLSVGARSSHGGRDRLLRGGLPALRAGRGGPGRRYPRPCTAPAPGTGLQPRPSQLDAGRRTPGEQGGAAAMEVPGPGPILCRARPGPGPADRPAGPSGGREPAGGRGGPGTPMGKPLRSASGPDLAARGAARGIASLRPPDRAGVPASRSALRRRRVRLAGPARPVDAGPTET